MKSSFWTSMLMAQLLLTTSCCVYNDDFDTRPAVGVPGTSSSEIEAMIVERQNQADYFNAVYKRR